MQITQEQKMFMEIGEITMAHQRMSEFRSRLRQLTKSARLSEAEALKDVSSFGMFEDCGNSYEMSYERTKGFCSGVESLRAEVIRMEKYVKLLCHSFASKYPEHQELMKTTLKSSVDEYANYLMNQHRQEQIASQKKQ